MCNHCIPLEDIDNRVKKGKYILHQTGGYHKFHTVATANPVYKKPHFPLDRKNFRKKFSQTSNLVGMSIY